VKTCSKSASLALYRQSGAAPVRAACLSQMTFDAKQAKLAGRIFGLNAEAQKWPQVVPYKGSLPTPVPTDPLICRCYEIVNVYGDRL
jgi:cyanate lyase